MPSSLGSLSPIDRTIHSLMSPLIVQSPWFGEFSGSPSFVSPPRDPTPCVICIGATPPHMTEPSVSQPRPIVTTGGLEQAFGMFDVGLNAPTEIHLTQVPVTFACMCAQSLEQQRQVIVSSTQSPCMKFREEYPVTFSMLATRY